jgi:hypothetical protein
MLICLVRRFWLLNVTDAMAPWLSMAIEIGDKLGSFWGKEVAGAPGRLISASRFRSHVVLGLVVVVA